MRDDTLVKRRGSSPPRRRSLHDQGLADPASGPGLDGAIACPRCATRLFPDELGDCEGHKVHAFHCILCGTYVEPGHVPDRHVVRTVRGPRGPRA